MIAGEVISSGKARERVLVVDDNVDLTELVAHGLTTFGYDVRAASDGLCALETAVAFRPQIVIIDIRLPIINGWEVAERLRSLSLFKRPRLFAMTALGGAQHHARSIAAGFENHFVKPIKLDELHRVLSTPERDLDERTHAEAS